MRLIAYATLCVSGAVGTIPSASAQDRPKLYDLDIEGGTLRQAVEEFREQADIEFLYSFELAQEDGVNPVQGQYTLEEALAVMFEGTNLSGGLTEGGVIVITHRQSGAMAQNGEEIVEQDEKRPSRLRRFFAALIGASSAAVAADGAIADETDGVETQVVDEIIVTALRRGEQTLMKTPIAISALTGEDIEISANSNIFDSLSQEPGVTAVTLNPNANQVQIRGLSAITGTSIVGYYLDEVPVAGDVQLPDANPFDLNRIEVLRGPQGTLYGYGSVGGTLRIITNDPVLNEFQFKAAGSWASAGSEGSDSHSANAAFNIPLGDSVAFRGVASHRTVGGFLDGTVSGEDDLNESELDSFRGKILFQPTDNLKIVGSVWSGRNDIGGQNFGTEDRIALVEDEHFESDTDLINLLAELDLEKVTFISSSSYYEGSSELEFLFSGITAITEGEGDGFTQEIRFNTKLDGNLNFNGGVIYTDAEGISSGTTIIEDVPFPTGISDPAFIFVDLETRSESVSGSESFAVFGEAHLGLMDGKLELTAGLRYFEDEQSLSGSSETLIDGLSTGVIPIPPTSETFDAVSPRFNLSYSVSDDLLLYANIAKGFRSGLTIDGGTLEQAAALGIDLAGGVDPDVLWNYEIGAKGLIAEGRFLYDVAVYYFDWTDVQITVPIIQGVLSVPQNAGGADAVGVDFSFVARPTDRLSLSLNGNFNNAQFTEELAALNIEKGDRLDNSVRESYGADVTYRAPLPFGNSNGGLELMFNTNYQHNSAREVRSFGTVGTADSLDIMSARIGIESEKWGIYLFGNNVLDETGAVGGTSADFMLRLAPPIIGVNGRIKF